MPASVTTESIDYVLRSGLPIVSIDGGSSETAAATAGRRLRHVLGVGRFDKGATAERPTDPALWRLPTTDLLVGLYGQRVPFSFLVVGTPRVTTFHVGVWSSKSPPSEPVLDERVRAVETLLAGLYPDVRLEAVGDGPGRWPVAGIGLGVPTTKPPERGDVALPWDRIVRSMRGAHWGALVLAVPVGETTIASMRDAALNEIREASTTRVADDAASPLTDYYVELLKAALHSSQEATTSGAWRTAVYLLGDATSYPRLSGVWRSVFSGAASIPEPVRVFEHPAAADLADRWSMPDVEGRPGPSAWRRPLELQTVLTSSQLAAYVHLPDIETPGFAIDLATRFDTARVAGVGPRRIELGSIVAGAAVSEEGYGISLDSLSRHALVAGVTGGGKTNTILSVLESAAAAGVPFCVIEPAKTEYRALLNHPVLGPRLRVFTVGNESVSPLRLNPLEVPDGIAVATHLDLLRMAFLASFGAWTPLPQVLERCLLEVYADAGWDLATNTNLRIAPGESAEGSFPSISDLVAKVAVVVRDLGYDDRVSGDLRAALTTRLSSLRSGVKGAMYDVRSSIPMDTLFGSPCVIELEALGDDGDKAFLSALLLIRLVEHRRGQGARPDLAHVLVIEEAHRLLGQADTSSSEESGDARGYAVEAFSNLLSEVRAYGQGVIVADQVPVRLAPDVVKNTNLKIAHRIVAADDQATLGNAMAMNPSQQRSLTSLPAGEAVVFSEGDDAPLKVRVGLVKEQLGATPSDHDVSGRMAAWRDATPEVREVFVPQAFCVETCRDQPRACQAARDLTGDLTVQRALSRTVLATVVEVGALDRLWDDLAAVLSSRLPPRVGLDALLRSFAGHGGQWLCGRLGRQAGWSLPETEELEGMVRHVLLDKLDGGDDRGSREAMRAHWQKLHTYDPMPYPYCDVVCPGGFCPYRYAVSDLVASGRFQRSWRDADGADSGAGDRSRPASWSVCQDAGYELLEFPDSSWPAPLVDVVSDGARRACLCFEQQMLADDERKVPRTSRRVMRDLLASLQLLPAEESATDGAAVRDA